LNPILQNRNYFYGYIIFWVLVAGAHFLSMFYAFHIQVTYSALDAVLYNLVYFPLGMAIWYIVRFNRMEAGKFTQLFTVHIISAITLSLMWVFISYNLTINIIHDETYLQLQKTVLLPARFLIGILYYVIVSLGYYLIIYYQNFREKIEKEAAVNTLLKEAELNALKLQINPHFIFNSLNSVNSLILIKPELAQEMVIKLSDFLRSTLSGNSKHMVTLKEELDFSKLYLEIEKIRFAEKLNFEINANGDYDSVSVPHMLFQPLLENAVKHGVQQSSAPVAVRMEICLENNFLKITIRNNFDGISRAGGKKIGLKNIKERLTLIYDQPDLLHTEVVNNEFIVIIKLPVTISPIHE